MNEIWIEKYRPKTLKEMVGQRDIVDRLQSYVSTKNLPHLMFAGPAGTGKTTSAIALAKELYGEGWRNNFNELNASDERGIDVVRGKIKEFARTAPMGGAAFKIIFLDEADALTSDAQAALRRTMEKYSRTCRFILSCVTSDTKILLSDDREISIDDFMRKFKNKEIKNTLGLNEDTRVLENDLVLFGMQMNPSANNKRVYELTTMNGRTLKVTEDHPILTKDGWINAGEIVPGTEVVVYPNLERTPFEEDLRQVVDIGEFKKFLINIVKGRTDRAINELAEKGLLPLTYSDEHIGALTRIVAFLMGNGHLSRDHRGLLFVGNKETLEAVKKDLETLQIKSSRIQSKKINSKIAERSIIGTTNWFYVPSEPFALLCKYLGAQSGDKVTKSYFVPSWVLDGTRFVKREFLRSLFGCEADAPAPDGKETFNMISFRQHKVTEIRNDALAFFEQLKQLLSQFNIDSYIGERKTSYIRNRDGKTTIIFSLVLDSSSENMLSFFKQVGYAYEKEKIKKAQLAGEYLKHKLYTLEQQKIKTALILVENNNGTYRELATRYDRSLDLVANQIKGKPDHLPRDFIDYSEWVKRYDIPGTELVLNEIICKKEVECNDVRDIGCFKNHNFIANGIVSHNCNYSSKIIEPIQSRCAVFRFRPLRAEDIRTFLVRISKEEGLDITDDALDALVHVSQGDMRKAVNSLQVAASMGQRITVDLVYHTTGTARPEEVKDLLETALKGDFISARNKLDEIMISYGLSGEDIIRQNPPDRFRTRDIGLREGTIDGSYRRDRVPDSRGEQ